MQSQIAQYIDSCFSDHNKKIYIWVKSALLRSSNLSNRLPRYGKWRPRLCYETGKQPGW